MTIKEITCVICNKVISHDDRIFYYQNQFTHPKCLQENIELKYWPTAIFKPNKEAQLLDEKTKLIKRKVYFQIPDEERIQWETDFFWKCKKKHVAEEIIRIKTIKFMWECQEERDADPFFNKFIPSVIDQWKQKGGWSKKQVVWIDKYINGKLTATSIPKPQQEKYAKFISNAEIQPFAIPELIALKRSECSFKEWFQAQDHRLKDLKIPTIPIIPPIKNII
jgi:hypothetical protein